MAIMIFLIPIEAELTSEIERLDGLFSMIKEYQLSDGPEQRFLQIRTSAEFRSIFCPFIAELLGKDLSHPIIALDETLKEWRNLWQGSSGKLNWMQQRGLLGELFVK